MNENPVIKPFLREVAVDLLKRFGNNLSSCCVVFPNKRARLFFSRYLGECSGGSVVWAPAYRTITELVQEFSGLTLADKTQLIFELFPVFKKITGTAANFDDFYYYCEMIIADFDEVDKSLVNARDLFINLADQRSIEDSFDYLTDNQLNAIRQFWNSFDPAHVSRDQKEFLGFWSMLPELYEGYRLRLKEKNLAYEGMIYREVADLIRGSGTLSFAYDYYILVGFNALNACEEIFFEHLKRIGKALFYWDYDDYYTGNEWHEAGYFIRDNARRFQAPASSAVCNGLTALPREITVIPVSSVTAQAKVLTDVIDRIGLQENTGYRNTALVLPDEKLMLPVLYSLPPYIRDINITMGYPLRESMVFSFTENFYQLHRNADIREGRPTAFYHKDIVALVKHPFIYNYYREIADGLISSIRENNSVYIGTDYLLQLSEVELFFRPLNSALDAVSGLLTVFELSLQNLLKSGTEGHNALQLECLYQAYKSTQRLSEMLNTSELSFSSQLLLNLLRKILRGMSVPFTGEPLAGLQVLGILETRLLDFDHVIILSMNEGTMPRSLPLSSFIPRNLRFGFGMSLPEHHDAVYAYYFYRLIQRAKQVFLIYNESADGLVTGERSRYIHQLAYEPLFHVRELRLEARLHETPVIPLAIAKTEKVVAKLDRYLAGNSTLWLSPSAINEFISCPLRFYYHRIASIDESEKVAEEVDPLIFGNLLHVSMHELYRPYAGKVVTGEILKGLMSRHDKLEDILMKAFKKELYKSGIEDGTRLSGMHLIIKEIIGKYALQILNADLMRCPFHVISLEEEHRASVAVKRQGENVRIQIGGIIDRVDQVNGMTRIIDYKTGIEKLSFDGVESLFTENPSKRNEAVFQVMLYACLYRAKHAGAPVVPCLVFARKSFDPGFSWFLKDQSDRTEVLAFSRYQDVFWELLQATLERLFDPSIPFSQTADTDFCTRCPYRGICHR